MTPAATATTTRSPRAGVLSLLWLPDPRARYAPDYEGEYDHLSLREAHRNVRGFGAIIPEAVERTRDPGEPRAPNWPYG